MHYLIKFFDQDSRRIGFAALALITALTLTGCPTPEDNSTDPTDTPDTTPPAGKILDLSTITTADAIKDAIIALAPGETNNGMTPDKALSLSISGLNVTNAAAMQNLLDGIGASGLYISLDLSGCTFADNTFPNLYNTSVANKSKICSITLPNTVTIIAGGTSETASRDSTFKGFTGLTSFTAPGITTIGVRAFYGCAALTSVSLPVATSIEDFAFYGCRALTSVDFPAAASIGHFAFLDCDALTSVSFPNVTSIGRQAFSFCDALTSVSLPAATSIDGSAFSGCTALTTFTIAATNTNYRHSDDRKMLLSKNGDTLIAYPSATGVVTLTGITTIGKAAFFLCSALTSVSLPAATSIGNSAFSNCAALTSVSLPAATSIDGFAFSGCTALTTFTVAEANTVYRHSDDKKMLLTKDGTTLIAYPSATGAVTLTGITSIEFGAFYGCAALTSITLGETPPTTVGDLFYELSARTITVKIPSGTLSAYTAWESANSSKFGNITLNFVEI